MTRPKGSKNKQPAVIYSSLMTTEERITLLANLIVEKLLSELTKTEKEA